MYWYSYDITPQLIWYTLTQPYVLWGLFASFVVVAPAVWMGCALGRRIAARTSGSHGAA